jgi:hypothetical protein
MSGNTAGFLAALLKITFETINGPYPDGSHFKPESTSSGGCIRLFKLTFGR